MTFFLIRQYSQNEEISVDEDLLNSLDDDEMEMEKRR